jgi:N-acetylglucosamine kinase-like BadF-type ATPase
MSEIIVGVDAGGSTTVVLADGVASSPRRIVGEAANMRTLGAHDAAAVVARTVREAIGTAAPRAIFVGAAGVGTAELASALRIALLTHFADARIGVSDDAHIALRAGVPSGDGAVLIAGTGSIAYAEVDSERYRVGGHGHLLGDEGSGYAIGNAALRWLLRSYEGRVLADPMTVALAETLGAKSGADVVSRIAIDEHRVRTVAALAPLVIEHADTGERSATKIVQGAAQEAFDLLKAVLKAAKIGDREVAAVLSGGLFSKNSLYTYLIETRISSEFPQVRPLKNAPAPEHGALSEAHRLTA